MLYFTQLIYIKPGQEKTFDDFEGVAIPLIARHGGQLLFRIRPDASSLIEGETAPPYEIHLVTFPDEKDFAAYAKDPARTTALHLKEASVDRIVLIKGNAL